MLLRQREMFETILVGIRYKLMISKSNARSNRKQSHQQHLLSNIWKKLNLAHKTSSLSRTQVTGAYCYCIVVLWLYIVRIFPNICTVTELKTRPIAPNQVGHFFEMFWFFFHKYHDVVCAPREKYKICQRKKSGNTGFKAHFWTSNSVILMLPSLSCSATIFRMCGCHVILYTHSPANKNILFHKVKSGSEVRRICYTCDHQWRIWWASCWPLINQTFLDWAGFLRYKWIKIWLAPSAPGVCTSLWEIPYLHRRRTHQVRVTTCFPICHQRPLLFVNPSYRTRKCQLQYYTDPTPWFPFHSTEIVENTSRVAPPGWHWTRW